MESNGYSLIVGRVTGYIRPQNEPRVRLVVDTGDQQVSVELNVRSYLPPHTLLFSTSRVSTQLGTDLAQLPDGVYAVSGESGLSLDYVRDYLMDREAALRIPYRLEDTANPVLQWLAFRFSHCTEESPGPKVYAWGNLEWQDAQQTTGDIRSARLHDVHMNQGSRGSFLGENRVRGDGGLIVETADGVMESLCLGFSSQCWDTDDRRGHPVGHELPDPVVDTDAVVRIVSALLNSEHESLPERPQQSITLINRSNDTIDLGGWRLEDHDGNRQILKGSAIRAGECLQIPLDSQRLQLRTEGGVVRLFADGDCLVHEVAYRHIDPLSNGWSILFAS